MRMPAQLRFAARGNMSEERTSACARSAIGHEICKAASFCATDWLGLAAAPTFAAMALLAGITQGDPADMLCPMMHSASVLHGMVPMYALMSVFHSVPWLKLIASRRNGARRS
jgi:hypothetical protein